MKNGIVTAQEAAQYSEYMGLSKEEAEKLLSSFGITVARESQPTSFPAQPSLTPQSGGLLAETKRGRMSKKEFSELLAEIQKQERDVREAGQQEYAHQDDNAFDNFARLAKQLQLTQEKVLMVYFMKHIDGIASYVNGHTSQREDIRGRIKDARMYLALLWGMVEADE